MITDYSAVAFEASVLDKKLYFYLYDIDEYKENRGLNINVKKEMPENTFYNINDLINSIQQEKYNYEEAKKIHNTERIVKCILNCMEEEHERKK